MGAELDILAELPLTHLSLASCQLTDTGIGKLRKLRLDGLQLQGCQGLSDVGLQHLRDMPLSKLSLAGEGWPSFKRKNGWLTDAGLAGVYFGRPSVFDQPRFVQLLASH